MIYFYRLSFYYVFVEFRDCFLFQFSYDFFLPTWKQSLNKPVFSKEEFLLSLMVCRYMMGVVVRMVLEL